VKKLLLASFTFGALIAPAAAADMPIKAPRYVAPPPTWSGFYAGLNAGWVDSQNSLSTVATPTPDAALGVIPGVSEGLAALSSGSIPVGSRSGFIGGGQIGYNWQLGSLVAGIEADIQGLSQSGGAGSVTTTAVVVGVPVTSTQTASLSTKYLGTVRGRLGLLLTPTWLVYATGGLAYGGVDASTSLVQSGTNGFVGTGAGSLSDTRAGWAAGGGVEWMFAQRWSAKGEYLHYDLGTSSFASASTSGFFATPVYQNVLSSAHFEGNLVRAGVIYHF
jgi:outer membrane immunogenic protein